MSKKTRLPAVALVLVLATGAAQAQEPPISVLFVGNSYTFGRLDPVLSYNAANVRDLTAIHHSDSHADNLLARHQRFDARIERFGAQSRVSRQRGANAARESCGGNQNSKSHFVLRVCAS